MKQLTTVEMEVALHRRDALGWAAEVRINDVKGDTENTKEGRITLDLDELSRLAAQRDAYARVLTEAFFGDDAVSWGFTLARAAAGSGPLRIRLRIGPSAPELHAVRWELLRDRDRPEANLVTQERVIFSRFLDSRDYRTVEVRPDQAMRAVVAVAGPETASLKRYEEDGRSLAPVEVAAEIARARAAIGGADVTSLGETEPVTLDRLLGAIRGGPDILYLVCHGWINRQGRDPGPRLLLQDENGDALHVTGREFVSRLRELLGLPRLVVLASCMSAASEAADSASTGDDGALSAVGPEVAAIGVPAVIAMQANISVATITKMMPRFFSELREDPEIDRAFSVARSLVQDRDDWWVPVLFMRLRSGRIWYEPGFSGGVDEWPALLDQIEGGRLTPILGSGLTDGIVGSRQELARQWARVYKFPIPPPLDEDLPQVAQFVSKMRGENFLRDRLREFVGQRIVANFREELTTSIGAEQLARVEGKTRDPDALMRLVREVGRLARSDPHEGHNVLASLPLPLYLTAEVSGLLADAVRATDATGSPAQPGSEGARDPISESFRWTNRAGVDWGAMPTSDPAETAGTVERPLIYSLFGQLGSPGSVVLSEDDYLEFLTSFSNRDKQASIPHQVLDALVDTSLLFVGFRIDDWDFRVLFRAILSLEGSGNLQGYPHWAIQLDPEASFQLDPRQVRSYIERYFGRGVPLTIYWGNTATFLRQLAEAWAKRSS
jgi:hypothetical protein